MSVYLYVCKVCGSPAHKEPLQAHKPGELANGTLGTWHCSSCKTKVKVARRKPMKEGE